MFLKICQRSAFRNAMLVQTMILNKSTVSRGFMTMPVTKSQHYTSILINNSVRMFNSDGNGQSEGPLYSTRGKPIFQYADNPIDERIPRVMKK